MQLQMIGALPTAAARTDIGRGKGSSVRKGRVPLPPGKGMSAPVDSSSSAASGLRFAVTLLSFFGIGSLPVVSVLATPAVEDGSDASSSTSSTSALGEEEGAPAGCPSFCTRQYDRKLLAEKTAHLRRVRAGGNVKEMMFALRLDLVRNIANIAKRWVGYRGRGKRPARFSPSARFPHAPDTIHSLVGSLSKPAKCRHLRTHFALCACVLFTCL